MPCGPRRYSTYLRSVNSLGRVHACDTGSDRRRAAAGRRPRTPPVDRRPRNGPRRDDQPGWRRQGADRPHRRRLSAAQRDHQPGDVRRPAAERDPVGRARLHGDDRPRARGAADQAPRRSGGHRRVRPGPRPRPGSGDPVRPGRVEDPSAADRLRQGRRRQVERDDQPGGRPCRPGSLGRCRRRRHLWLFDPADARNRPRPDGDRRDAPASRALGGAVHLDRLLRSRGRSRDLARPDVAQGARAVPHRCLLG